MINKTSNRRSPDCPVLIELSMNLSRESDEFNKEHERPYMDIFRESSKCYYA